MKKCIKLCCFRIAVALLFVTGIANSSCFADNSGKSALIEIKAPTRIPGMTLKPGSYLFRLSGTDSGWNIIQVYNQDGSSLITTVLAYPNPKIQRSGEGILIYSHGIKGASRVMKGWFFENENEAQQWAYPNSIAEQIGKANRDRIPTTGTDDVYPSALPQAAKSWTPPLTAASNDNAQTENSTLATASSGPASPRKLPRTASTAPLAGLLGIIAALAIVLLRRAVRIGT